MVANWNNLKVTDRVVIKVLSVNSVLKATFADKTGHANLLRTTDLLLNRTSVLTFTTSENFIRKNDHNAAEKETNRVKASL